MNSGPLAAARDEPSVGATIVVHIGSEKFGNLSNNSDVKKVQAEQSTGKKVSRVKASWFFETKKKC